MHARLFKLADVCVYEKAQVSYSQSFLLGKGGQGFYSILPVKFKRYSSLQYMN